MKLFTCILLLNSVFSTYAAKILVIAPSISNSHVSRMGLLADVLVKDGHDVTMFIPKYSKYAMKNGTKLAKIVRLNEVEPDFGELVEGFDVFDPDSNLLKGRFEIKEFLAEICGSILSQRHKFNYLKDYNFDLAVTNGIEFCGIGLVHYLGIKNHIWYMTNPIHENVAFYTGVPQPISYVPVVETNALGPKMNFFERTENFYQYIVTSLLQYHGMKTMNNAFRKHLGPNFPRIQYLGSRTNIVVINGDEFLDAARPILHKTVYIGGLDLEEPKPLVEPYKTLMEKGQKGVILLSFGTIAPTTFIKQTMKEDIFEAFSEFSDYHFIIKIDKEDNSSRILARKYENIDVLEWLPQKDMLAHPRLKLFIVHGGYNSLLESAINGVPVIVIPMFADQFRNAKNAEYRGFGYYLDRLDFNKGSLKRALTEVLSNPSYKNSAVRLSQLIKDKPFKPKETFLKWVRFVANHGILPELEPEGARMNFLRYFCLDVFFGISIFISLALYVFYKILSISMRSFIRFFTFSKIKLD